MALVANLPTTLRDAGAAAVGSKVYFYGGFDGTQWVDILRIYDATLDSYSTGTARGATFFEPIQAAAIGTTIYFCGEEEVHPYDTVGDSWGTSLLTPYIVRVNIFNGVKNNQLYRLTIDGVNYDYTSDADATEDEVIDGIKNKLDTNDPSPPPGTISWFKSTTAGNHPALVIERTNPATAISDNNELDARAITSFDGTGVAVANGKLIAYRGIENNVFKYEPGTGFDAIQVQDLSFDSLDKEGVTISDEAYFLGGGGVKNYKFNEVSNTWTALADLPDSERDRTAAGVFNGKAYLLGGFDGVTFGSVASVREYDPVGDSWAYAPVGLAGNIGPSDHFAAALPGGIFVAGGIDNSDGGSGLIQNIAQVWSPSVQSTLTLEYDVDTPILYAYWDTFPNPEEIIRVEWSVPSGFNNSAGLIVQWATGNDDSAVLSVLYDNVDNPPAVPSKVVKIEGF